MTNRLFLAAVVALATASWICPAAGEPEPMKLASPDREFVMEAGMGGLAEIKLAQLAIERASSERVKRFARTLFEDHTRTNAELASLAKEKGDTLPLDVGPEHKVALGKLSALSGAAFDRAFAAHAVEDHAKDVAAFEKEASTGKDLVVKAWASRTLPTLREHLRMARQIAARLGAPAAQKK